MKTQDQEYSARAARSAGTAFAILYAPRANAGPPPAPNRQGHNANSRFRGDPKNSAPNFNTPIATKTDSLRTAAIKGRG